MVPELLVPLLTVLYGINCKVDKILGKTFKKKWQSFSWLLLIDTVCLSPKNNQRTGGILWPVQDVKQHTSLNTDTWQVYGSVLPASKHAQTKAETHSIERNNCLMRHWFWRFRCKSIIVSKGVEMVDLTIALFARFRVNGNVFDILNLGKLTSNTIS